MLGKRKRTYYPHPRWHPLARDVESDRLTRPCDVFEITKKHDVYSLEFTAVQSEMASLKNAWDAANRASIEERQSIFGRLECLYQSLISKLLISEALKMLLIVLCFNRLHLLLPHLPSLLCHLLANHQEIPALGWRRSTSLSQCVCLDAT